MNKSQVISAKNIVSKGNWYHSIDYENETSKGTFDYRKLVFDLNIPKMDNNTLVLFPSFIQHEVKPVIGEGRYSLNHFFFVQIR